MSTIFLTDYNTKCRNNTPLKKKVITWDALLNQINFVLKHDLGIVKSSIVPYNFFVKDIYFHGNNLVQQINKNTEHCKILLYYSFFSN